MPAQRRKPAQTSLFAVCNLILDQAGRTVRRGDTDIRLTKHEFDLLEYLTRNRGIV